RLGAPRSRVILGLIPSPPRPTLFPYTTLFRSKPVHRAVDLAAQGVEAGGDGRPDELRGAQRRSHQTWHGRDANPALVRQGLRTRDRKSTRLNSSHVAISYAVFCLKKKT